MLEARLDVGNRVDRHNRIETFLRKNLGPWAPHGRPLRRPAALASSRNAANSQVRMPTSSV